MQHPRFSSRPQIHVTLSWVQTANDIYLCGRSILFDLGMRTLHVLFSALFAVSGFTCPSPSQQVHNSAKHHDSEWYGDEKVDPNRWRNKDKWVDVLEECHAHKCLNLGLVDKLWSRCCILTATKVAGKKMVVTMAIVFIAVLSDFEACAIFEVVRLKYC